MTEESTSARPPDAELPRDLLAVLRGRAVCFLTTLLPDGSPHVTQTWVDTDGEHVLINTVETHQKMRNVLRDPRVGLGVVDPASPMRSWGLRGRVISTTAEGAREHLDLVSQRYLGRPYPGFGGRGNARRMLLTVAVDRIHSPG